MQGDVRDAVVADQGGEDLQLTRTDVVTRLAAELEYKEYKNNQDDAHGLDSNVSCTITSKIEELVENIEGASPRAVIEANEELYVEEVATLPDTHRQLGVQQENQGRHLRSSEIMNLLIFPPHIPSKTMRPQ